MQKRTVLVASLLAGTAISLCAGSYNGTAGATPPTEDYHWYHPTGGACPSYQYDPKVKGEEAKAKAQCEKDTHGACSSKHGTAAPAC
jgi:hypothetical protein